MTTMRRSLNTLPPLAVGRERGAGAASLQDAKAAHYAAWSALFVVLYVALDAVSFVFPFGPIPVTPWNPQVALAVAIVLVGGVRFAPVVVIAPVLAEWLVRGALHGPAFEILGGLGLGLAYAGTALAFANVARHRPIAHLRVLRDFIVVSLLGTAAAAVVYVGLHGAIEGATESTIVDGMLHKWLGDFAGVVATAPLLFALLAPRPMAAPRRRAFVDALLFGAVLLSLTTVVFGLDSAQGHKLFYLLFLPLIYLAVRHEFFGAAAGVAAVQVAVIVGMAIERTPPGTATEYQLLMTVLATTTLLLGSFASERRAALAVLSQRSAELRAQQAALSDAMRAAAANETASTLAHEMSQPLSAIGTYARAGLEMLKRGSAQPADLAGVLERIERETARSSEVVHRIRDFFRTGVGHREPVSLSTVLLEAADAVHDRVEAADIALTIDVPYGLPRVFADRVQLGTVFHNLLGNAIDALAASPGTARIRVTARLADRFVEIDVEDTGPGVPETVAATLFEPLSTTKPTGMGLGLAISRTIIHAHGGRLWLASSHPTTFRFTLPIHGEDLS